MICDDREAIHTQTKVCLMEYKQPKSIIILTQWFPNWPDDRRFTYIYDSAVALGHRGVAVHVLVCRPYAPPLLGALAPDWARGHIEIAKFDGLASVTLIHYPALPGGLLKGCTSFIKVQRIVSALKLLARRCKAELIHAHTEGLALAASTAGQALGLPSVVTIHGLNTELNHVHAGDQPTRIGRALCDIDRVILVGDPLRPFFGTLVGRDDHFRVVYNGVRFPSGLTTGAILRDLRNVRFITVSNLEEGKGIDIALRALGTLRDQGHTGWNYTIVGDGAERVPLSELCVALGLTEFVTFVGAQSHDAVFKFLGEADIFLLPSYREAFGIAYLEAMVAGLLAVGVRGQGPEAFIVHGKTGFLVEPNSPTSLVDCIRDILAQPEIAQRIAASGAEIVRSEFTWDAHAQHLIEVYGELVG